MSTTLVLMVKGVQVCKLSPAHLPYHTPRKCGDRPWKIIVEGQPDNVIDSYTPARVVKPQPITPFKGSWAQSMKR